MDRRKFLRNAAAGAAGVAVISGCKSASEATGEGQGEGGTGGQGKAASGPAVHTGKKIRWRLASSFPRSLDTIYGAADVVAEIVKNMSGGQFEIRVHAPGELVPGLQVMDAVQQGTVQAGHSAGYYYIGKNPALAFDTCVPFGLNSRQQSAWLLTGGGMELMGKLYGDFGIKNFLCGCTGVQMGGWFNKEISTVADLQGLRMRIPGLGGKVMNRLGASAQVIAGGEIYTSLERGAIDAAEWVGPYDDEQLGFHKVAKYYYYPGWWEPGSTLSLLVNQKAWNDLPAEYQAMLQAASIQAHTQMQALYDSRNAAAIARMLAGEDGQGGIDMRPYSEEIMTAAAKATNELLEEQASSDATYRQIYDQWKKFREDSQRWFGTAESAFAQFAFGR